MGVSFSGRSAAWLSALEWGSRGRWFESSRPDHLLSQGSKNYFSIFYTSFFSLIINIAINFYNSCHISQTIRALMKNYPGGIRD
jgi:hypothetical protein